MRIHMGTMHDDVNGASWLEFSRIESKGKVTLESLFECGSGFYGANIKGKTVLNCSLHYVCRILS